MPPPSSIRTRSARLPLTEGLASPERRKPAKTAALPPATSGPDAHAQLYAKKRGNFDANLARQTASGDGVARTEPNASGHGGKPLTYARPAHLPKPSADGESWSHLPAFATLRANPRAADIFTLLTTLTDEPYHFDPDRLVALVLDRTAGVNALNAIHVHMDRLSACLLDAGFVDSP